MTDVEKYVRDAKMPKVFNEVLVKEYPRIIPKDWLVEKLGKWFNEQQYEVEAEHDKITGQTLGIIGLKKGFKLALQEQFALGIQHTDKATNIKLEFWGRTQKKMAVVGILTLGGAAVAAGASSVSQTMEAKKFIQQFGTYLDSIVEQQGTSTTTPSITHAPATTPSPAPQTLPQTNACPSCHKSVAADFAICPFCGNHLKSVCPKCNKEVSGEFVMCPFCGQNLGQQNMCKKCGKELKPEFSMCPFCGTAR